MAPPTRKPTGAVPYPIVLVEGAEKSGKSWSSVLLSASPRVGRMFAMDLSEGGLDDYGLIPGVRFEIIRHDGTWENIMLRIREAKEEAQRAAEAKEPPTVLMIDPVGALWDLLKEWANIRAAATRANRQARLQDPNAEIRVPRNVWNDVDARWRALMTELKTFPGIVIVTAQGKVISATGEDGQPIPNKKDYRVEAHKTLGADVSCWVRLSRDEKPRIIGARSVHAGVRPGRDEPFVLPDDWSMEWLVFEHLKFDPAKAHTRNLVNTRAARTAEEIRDEVIDSKTSYERELQLWDEARELGYDLALANEHGADEPLPKMIQRHGAARNPAPVGNASADGEAAREQLTGLWARAELTDPAGQVAYAAETVGRDLASLDDLTGPETTKVVDRLARFVEAQAGPPDEASAGPAETPAEPLPPADAQTPPPSEADVPSAQDIADEAMATDDPNVVGTLQNLAKDKGKLADTITHQGKQGQLGVLLRNRKQHLQKQQRSRQEAAA